MKRVLCLLLLTGGCTSTTSSPAAKAPPAPSASRAPYDTASSSVHSIGVAIDTHAAQEILASLSRPRLDFSDAKVLQDLPAVRLAIQDSHRSPEVFERDFAAAFDPESRTAVFDFRTIRQGRERWEALLAAINSREPELARLVSSRAATLLPSNPAVAVRTQVYVSFGLAGLEDHLVVRESGGREVMIVDLVRALGDAQGEPVNSQISRLARLMAGQAYRQAWTAYREASPRWKAALGEPGPLELFLHTVAAAGPVAIFSVDENFFPLCVWLKEPMRRSIEDFNRRAERYAQSRENLEQRMELTAELRRGDFDRRVAAPVGAFLSDAIIESLGLAAFRAALEEGPKAFFEAYNRATQVNRALVPLSRVIREELEGHSKASSP